jgi:exodeoxyribonuclease VII large subunit
MMAGGDAMLPILHLSANAAICDLFDGDERMQNVWVTGEVSNMTRASSGHWYFTLKDGGAALKCVMFRAAVLRQSVHPADGDAILAHGRVSVYETRGEYQLYADLLQPEEGRGDLYLRFEELKANWRPRASSTRS